jgi:hypothetical protein
MKQFLLTGLATCLLLADGNSGLAPRGNCSNYSACAKANGVAIGAEALSAAQAKKIFAADLDRAGYLVFEVAVYPEDSFSTDLALRNFELRADGTFLRPAESDVVAVAAIPDPALPKSPPPGNIHVITETTVGYGTGGYGRGGVYTEQRVGVTNYPEPPAPPAPPSTSKDRKRDDLESTLADHALPAVRANHPVAGYMYFPKPDRAGKIKQYQLTWSGPDGAVSVTIPAAK